MVQNFVSCCQLKYFFKQFSYNELTEHVMATSYCKRYTASLAVIRCSACSRVRPVFPFAVLSASVQQLFDSRIKMDPDVSNT